MGYGCCYGPRHKSSHKPGSKKPGYGPSYRRLGRLSYGLGYAGRPSKHGRRKKRRIRLL